MLINGRKCNVLIDTGCSVTLIGEGCLFSVIFDERDCVKLEMLNSQSLFTRGSVMLESVLHDGMQLGPIKARYCSKLPVNIDVIMGLDVISHHGLHVMGDGNRISSVSLGCSTVAAVGVEEDRREEVTIDDLSLIHI